MASISVLRIWCCCELWCRWAAVAPIRPLPWEPPYAAGAALKKTKKKKRKRKKERKEIMPFAATRMDLEIILLSELSQAEKGK